jgi:uroporphyrinogen decarboxylase
VPIGLFVQEEFLAYFFPERPAVDRVIEGVECAKAFGFDILTRSLTFNTPYFFRKSYPNWELDHKTTREDGNIYYITTVTTPEGVLTQIEAAPYHARTVAGIHRTTTRYLLDAEKDFEIFRKFVPEIDRDSIQEMKASAWQAKQVIGDVGVSAPWGWGGVYNQAATYRDVQKLMMDPYLNPEFYQEYMGTLTRLIVKNYAVLGETEFDCLGIQGNIANAAMVGPKFFDQYILPYEQQVVNAIRQAGKYSLYHNCGKARVLYPSYLKLEMDIWETVSPPPQGDNDLAEAKAVVGDKLVLSGNLDQVVFLKKATPEEVDREVTRIMQIGKPGGKYIFAASDFLEKDTPLENVRKVVEVAIREGQYD